MRKKVVPVAVILTFAAVGAAQDIPKMETFLGYTYVRASSATNAPSFNANGGSGQFAYNFNQYLAAVADLGAVHNRDIGDARLDSTLFNFLFGPRLSLRYSRIRPYVQVLFGGVYGASSIQVAALIDPSSPVRFLPVNAVPPSNLLQAVSARIGASQTAFALTAGGGLDVRVNKHICFRPIGLDYYLTRLQNLRSADDNNQNSLRYTTGFNLTFGAR